MGFDHSHYMPIMKAKAGEFWALAHLKPTTKPLVTPLFELVPHDAKKTTFDADSSKKIDGVAECWQRPFFFDVRHIAPKGSLPDATTVSSVFKKIRARDMHGIPVTRIGYSQKFQESVREIIKSDAKGAMIRLATSDLAIKDKLQTALANLCSFLGINEGNIDLLIDYEFRKPDDYEDLLVLQALHLTKIPNIQKWRTVTVASASFPESIKDLPDGEWIPLDRTEWKSWEHLIKADGTARKPAYGDYGIRHPSLPGFGQPKPNLRYTIADGYLCRRDEAKHAAIKEICRSLIKKNEYKGPDFSDGDQAISKTAANQGSGGTGGGKEWTQWCSNHHVEFVATQIQSLPSA